MQQLKIASARSADTSWLQGFGHGARMRSTAADGRRQLRVSAQHLREHPSIEDGE